MPQFLLLPAYYLFMHNSAAVCKHAYLAPGRGHANTQRSEVASGVCDIVCTMHVWRVLALPGAHARIIGLC